MKKRIIERPAGGGGNWCDTPKDISNLRELDGSSYIQNTSLICMTMQVKILIRDFTDIKAYY